MNPFDTSEGLAAHRRQQGLTVVKHHVMTSVAKPRVLTLEPKAGTLSAIVLALFDYIIPRSLADLKPMTDIYPAQLRTIVNHLYTGRKLLRNVSARPGAGTPGRYIRIDPTAGAAA